MNCIGGQLIQPLLNAKLEKDDPQKFEIGKAYLWNSMINDRMKPKKWFKTTKNGQKVNFDSIQSKEQLEVAKGELGGYLAYLNEKYGTDYKLTVEKAKV